MWYNVIEKTRLPPRFRLKQTKIKRVGQFLKGDEMARGTAQSCGRLVHIVDDDDAVRRSESALLKSMGYHIQTWMDGRSFLKAAPSLGPSCILLDLTMPGPDGISVQIELARQGINWPIIFLSGTGNVPQAVTAVKQGAVHFLLKPTPPAELKRILDQAFERLAELEEQGEGGCLAQTRLSRLTPRENDVLNGLVEGLPNKSIAFDLGVSPRTIEAHRAKIMRKLEANNFAHVLRTVFEARL